MNVADCTFQCGEVYLFSQEDAQCPSETSLWGLYDKTEHGNIYLECRTSDLVHFENNVMLPETYRYVRLAERDELRDFSFCLGCKA